MRLTSSLTLLPSFFVLSLLLSGCNDSSTNPSVDTIDTLEKRVLNEEDQQQSDQQQSDQQDPTEDTTVKNSTVSIEEKMINTLARYHWTLENATDELNKPLSSLINVDEPVTLSFNSLQDQRMLNYSVGCNTMSANYELQGSVLKIGDSMSTKMSCGELDESENQLNDIMQGISQLSFLEKEPVLLTQIVDDSTTLVWSGTLTPQAKYNAKGDTIFWKVAANTKPCTSNGAQPCLQIKPIAYNEQGLKISEGEWIEFAGTIDGYQHDDNHDEVLRLQRFKTTNDTVLVDNIDSKYAYVLDTVIESELVK